MPLKCVRIALYLPKLITFFEIQDGGCRNLGFWKIFIFDFNGRQWLVLGICCYNLVRIALSMRKLLTFFEIQDGGRRHLVF